MWVSSDLNKIVTKTGKEWAEYDLGKRIHERRRFGSRTRRICPAAAGNRWLDA